MKVIFLYVVKSARVSDSGTIICGDSKYHQSHVTQALFLLVVKTAFFSDSWTRFRVYSKTIRVM
jgi:hypothetical protein